MVEDHSIALLTLAEASRRMRQRQLSPVDLVKDCLQRIEKFEGAVNSFISVYADEALAQARLAEQELVTGHWRGALHGIPIAVKDLMDMAGKPTTAASALFLNNIRTQDAEVVALLQASGAIIIGKNNLHEFAYGGSGVISYFGPVHNPKDTSRIAGGSSSGSAAAVAAGFCYAAIGTDTAGSIRLPAACCGVVGLKPSFQRLSTKGVVPLSPSYDHVGPITRTAEDAALVFGALMPSFPEQTHRRLRIGVARDFFCEGVHTEILRDVEKTIEELSPEVECLREVTVPVDEDRTISSAESWLYHKQFMDRAEAYDPRTLARIRTGECYRQEDLAWKRRDLERLRASVSELFVHTDVILSPTVPIPPPALSSLEASAETLRATELLMLRNTRPWNVYGVPALTVPCGQWAAVQISGLDEATVLHAARLIERARA